MNAKQKSFQKKLSVRKRNASKVLRNITIFCFFCFTVFAFVKPVSASNTSNFHNIGIDDSGTNPDTATPILTIASSNTPSTTPEESTATFTDIPSTPTIEFTKTPEPSTPTLTNTPEQPTVTTTITVALPTSNLTHTAEPPTTTVAPTLATSLPTATMTSEPTVGNIKSQASTTTYYVSTTGSDSNPGTLSQPFKTIQKGINSLAAGNTLYVRGGTYTEAININNSGTSSTPIDISSYPGETAKLDGSGLNSSLAKYDTRMVSIYGSYIIFENFEITYPLGYGFIDEPAASHNIIRNLNIHNTWGQGVNIWGNNNIFENSKVWETNLSNKASPGSSGWGGALTVGDSSHANYGVNSIISGNQVYQNYGEGILCMYTNNVVIEGNRVWDDWALGIYPDSCSYTTIDKNLVYFTDNHEFWRYAKSSPPYPSLGIYISNENLIAGMVGHDRKIYNNILVNTNMGFYFNNGGTPGSTLNNDIITNNTIINEETSYHPFGIYIDAPASNANHKNTIIENNLVLVANGLSGNAASSTQGLTFSHNLWAKAPNSSVNGTGDYIGDPQLVNPTQTVALDQITYPLNTAAYALSPSSPAINKASSVSGVADDYFGNNRGTSPDMGAIEFMSTPAPTSTPNSTPTSTPTSTPPPSSIQLNPVADDYISSAFPTSNYGTDTVLKVRYSPARIAYLRFNVSGLNGKAVKSATLRLRTQTASSVPIYVRNVSNTTWTETGLTYKNKPALGSTHIAGPKSFQAETWISINVTSLVKGGGLISLAVTLQNSASLSFYSRESGSNAPQLVIVPAS